MKSKSQTLLTIGIIFKNEIRCLERCIKSLEPLRKAIPCELIMADTGSDDGSREIAALYADTLFDFPWIDDFSAARNAVMDKSAGQWYLSIDADEYLDSNISELISFLNDNVHSKRNVAGLIIRNYKSISTNSDYMDFMAIRMARISSGVRFHGAIHEALEITEEQAEHFRVLSKTMFHHDGYVNFDEDSGRAKKERNLALIRKAMKKEPENLNILLQYLDSGNQEVDYVEVLRSGVAFVKKKCNMWREFGPIIYSRAVWEAQQRGLSEREEWYEQSLDWFPDSYFTCIDTEYFSFLYYWDQQNYARCICHGEHYLQSLADYRAGKGAQYALLYHPLATAGPFCEQALMIRMADALLKENDTRKAVRLLEQIDSSITDETQTEDFIRVLWKLHISSNENTATALLHFFEKMQKSASNKEQNQKCMNAFYHIASYAFDTYDDNSMENRKPYTLFLPLGERSELGRAAMILESKDSAAIQELLSGIKDWGIFPIEALVYAIDKGVDFPVLNKPLKLEEIDNLAEKFSQNEDRLFHILSNISKENIQRSWQKLFWTERLTLIAVRRFDWLIETPVSPKKTDAYDVDEGFNLAIFFANVEKLFLPRYYSQDVLQEKNILSLPLLHRFGWYCTKAFESLEQGNAIEYVRKLRASLVTCPEMRDMVGYLTKYTPQLQKRREETSPELQLLTKQVKKLLSSYPANDPTIAAIKASNAYQRVAGIIENSD